MVSDLVYSLQDSVLVQTQFKQKWDLIQQKQ